MGYLLGIDGGATKTAAILADENGNILNRAIAPASNYHAVGLDKASEALHKVVNDVVNGAGETLDNCSMAVIGLAGVNNDYDQQLLQDEVDKIGIGGDVHVENDIVIAWAASTLCQPGVVVIAGTGSSAFGVNENGERYKSLGWDYVIADQGSGYWIGLNGLQTAFKVWDGRLIPDDGGQLLYEAMLDHLKVESGEDGVSKIYSDDFMDDMKTNVASFTRRVAECAQNGDVQAQRILNRAGEELAAGVCAVIRKLGMTDKAIQVGHVGSSFRSGEFILDPFTETILAVAPQAQIKKAEYRAQVGALIYGYNELGTLSDDIIDNLPTRAEMPSD